MKTKKRKIGYKKNGKVKKPAAPPTTFDWPDMDEKLIVKQFYIKTKDGKFIKAPKKMIGKKIIAKKGGKV